MARVVMQGLSVELMTALWNRGARHSSLDLLNPRQKIQAEDKVRGLRDQKWCVDIDADLLSMNTAYVACLSVVTWELPTRLQNNLEASRIRPACDRTPPEMWITSPRIIQHAPCKPES